MRNIWKGLVVGAVTGAFVGLTLDLMYDTRDEVTGAARRVRRRAPEAADWVAGMTWQARTRLRRANLPRRARTLASDISDSDLAKQVVDVTASGRRAVETTLNNARRSAR